MAIFPKIQSPCPYRNELASILEGDMCRMCKRQVFDLSAMTDDQRVALLSGCTEEVCVSYRLPIGAGLATAMALAAAAAPLAAAAQSTPTQITQMVMVGGIKEPGKVEYVQTRGVNDAPALPVVYEDRAPEPAPAQAHSRDAVPAKTAEKPAPADKVSSPAGS